MQYTCTYMYSMYVYYTFELLAPEIQMFENFVSKLFNYKTCLVVYKHLPYKMQ